MYLVGAVYDAVKDRVGNRCARDCRIPVVWWHLTGDDQGAFSSAIIHHLEEVAGLLVCHSPEGKVIEDNDVYFFQSLEKSGVLSA